MLVPKIFAVDMSAVVEHVENGSSPKASENGSTPSKFDEAIVVEELFLALFFWLDRATNVELSFKEIFRLAEIVFEEADKFMSEIDDIVLRVESSICD